MESVALFIVFVGLVLIAVGVFAWPVLQNVPSHRARPGVFGSPTARRVVLIGGLAFAAAGGVVLAVA